MGSGEAVQGSSVVVRCVVRSVVRAGDWLGHG